MGKFDHLGQTLAEVHVDWAATPNWKTKTRLDAKEAKAASDEGQLEKWRREVFRLDKFTCRHCECRVHRTLELVADQAQAHHIAGRADRAVRYDVRNGLTLCRRCHERVTGLVNDKLVIFGTRTFRIGQRTYINARATVRFKESA